MISNKLLQVCKEQIYKPCSVLDNHLSRLIVANKLKRTTILDQSRASFVYHPFVLAPDGVYIAYMSPYSWWALTSPFQPYRINPAVYFCCTSLKITPTWRYQASCSVVHGLSSYYAAIVWFTPNYTLPFIIFL